MNNSLRMPLEVAVHPAPAPLRLPRRLREFALYFAAAATGLVVDASLLVVLVQWLALPPLFAATLSFLAGSFAVYAVSVRFAFEHRRVRNSRFEFVVFALLGLGGLCVTLLVMWVGVDLLKIDYRLAKAAAAGASFVTNFAARKIILFTAA
jgi:putative flippase GtrA